MEQRHLSNFRKQPLQMWSALKSVLENFTKFTGKHLWFGTLLKDSNTGVFTCEIRDIFKKVYFLKNICE